MVDEHPDREAATTTSRAAASARANPGRSYRDADIIDMPGPFFRDLSPRLGGLPKASEIAANSIDCTRSSFFR